MENYNYLENEVVVGVNWNAHDARAKIFDEILMATTMNFHNGAPWDWTPEQPHGWLYTLDRTNYNGWAVAVVFPP